MMRGYIIWVQGHGYLLECDEKSAIAKYRYAVKCRPEKHIILEYYGITTRRTICENPGTTAE